MLSLAARCPPLLIGLATDCESRSVGRRTGDCHGLVWSRTVDQKRAGCGNRNSFHPQRFDHLVQQRQIGREAGRGLRAELSFHIVDVVLEVVRESVVVVTWDS